MKTSYPLLLLLLGVGSFAQPILNATDFPDNYSADVYTINYFEGLSPGSPGIDQVWDFSFLSLSDIPSGTTIVVPPSYSPDADGFPTANFCVKSNFIELAGPDDIYYMYRNTPTEIEFLGTSSFWGVVLYTDPYIYFQFPYIFGSTFNDIYIDNFSAVFSMSSSYDAYGTLITPFGTYSDVVREKRTEAGITYYRWFKTSPYRIVMEGNFSTDGSIHVFKNTSTLGTNEYNRNKSIAVSPNPTNSILNVQFPDNVTFDKIIITDLAMRTVLQQLQNLDVVDVQDLANGMYILRAVSGNDSFQRRFIKE